ncbi:MAG: bifunctional hydroxymethylpyrimidine kinase/phosphomethylpyrimidine kinase [bacterium]
MKRLLTIAGSDSGGGAGIQADLKTFQAFGCYGMSVLTAVTAQNTLGVRGVHDLPADFVALQLETVVTDIGVDAAKTGMLANAEIVGAVAERIRNLPVPHLVVDPVMRSKSGAPLLREGVQQALLEEMVPLAEVITPNLRETEVLTGMTVQSRDDMMRAAEKLHRKGAKNVLIKGGHRPLDALDILFDGQEFVEFFSERIPAANTHGTGCTYAAAIAANLALGKTVKEAVAIAKKFVSEAIRACLSLGKGIGPLNHLVWCRRPTPSQG